jgi:hypothetical protein
MMATIHQQIEVAAEPDLVSTAWDRFIHWVHTGPGHLACTELACVDAVRSGLVRFAPVKNGRTTVIFTMDESPGGPSSEELKRQLGRDLITFKDYVERSGLLKKKPTETEEAAFEFEAKRKGDPPRHVRLSGEADNTFWRSHFPT